MYDHDDNSNELDENLIQTEPISYSRFCLPHMLAHANSPGEIKAYIIQMLSDVPSDYLIEKYDLKKLNRPKRNYTLIPLEILRYLYNNYSIADCVMWLFTQWNCNKWGMSGDFANYDIRRFIKKLYSTETIRQSFRRLRRIGAVVYRYDLIRKLNGHVFKLRRLVSAFGEIKKIPPKDLSYLRINTHTTSGGDFLENNMGKPEIHGANSPPSSKNLSAFERNVSYTLKRLNLHYLDVVLFAKFLNWQQRKLRGVKNIVGLFISNYKAKVLAFNQPNILEKYASYVERQIDYYAKYKWQEMKEQFQVQAHALGGMIEKKERLPKPERKTQVTAYIPTPYESKEDRELFERFSFVPQDDPSEIVVEENFNKDDYLKQLLQRLSA